MESEGRSQCGSTALGFGFEAHHRRRDHRATCLSSSAGNACVMLPPCAGRGAGWGVDGGDLVPERLQADGQWRARRDSNPQPSDP